eukprot:gene17870-biopygen3890
MRLFFNQRVRRTEPSPPPPLAQCAKSPAFHNFPWAPLPPSPLESSRGAGSPGAEFAIAKSSASPETHLAADRGKRVSRVGRPRIFNPRSPVFPTAPAARRTGETGCEVDFCRRHFSQG